MPYVNPSAPAVTVKLIAADAVNVPEFTVLVCPTVPDPFAVTLRFVGNVSPVVVAVSQIVLLVPVNVIVPLVFASARVLELLEENAAVEIEKVLMVSVPAVSVNSCVDAIVNAPPNVHPPPTPLKVIGLLIVTPLVVTVLPVAVETNVIALVWPGEWTDVAPIVKFPYNDKAAPFIYVLFVAYVMLLYVPFTVTASNTEVPPLTVKLGEVVEVQPVPTSIVRACNDEPAPPQVIGRLMAGIVRLVVVPVFQTVPLLPLALIDAPATAEMVLVFELLDEKNPVVSVLVLSASVPAVNVVVAVANVIMELEQVTTPPGALIVNAFIALARVTRFILNVMVPSNVTPNAE